MIDGTGGDPYEALIKAKETSIRLVMINGVARYGTPELMGALAPADQTVRVGGQTRRLFLKQETADPDVAKVSLRAAQTPLREAFRDLAKLARELGRPKTMKRAALDAREPVIWSLALDETQPTGVDLRPRLPFNGPRDFTGPKRVSPRATAPLLSTILQPIALDPLTVADDDNFLTEIAGQPNVPKPVRTGLAQLY